MPFRREITRAHLGALIDLEVAADQADQVAPNAVTIAQAAYEPDGFVWGLWDGEVAVGLLAMIDLARAPDARPEESNAAYIWRLMIGEEHQGRGFGRDAIQEAAEIAADWARPRLLVAAVDKAGGAIPFYERLGFSRTGEIADGEVEMAAPTDLVRARTARGGRLGSS